MGCGYAHAATATSGVVVSRSVDLRCFFFSFLSPDFFSLCFFSFGSLAATPSTSDVARFRFLDPDTSGVASTSMAISAAFSESCFFDFLCSFSLFSFFSSLSFDFFFFFSCGSSDASPALSFFSFFAVFSGLSVATDTDAPLAPSLTFDFFSFFVVVSPDPSVGAITDSSVSFFFFSDLSFFSFFSFFSDLSFFSFFSFFSAECLDEAAGVTCKSLA